MHTTDETAYDMMTGAWRSDVNQASRCEITMTKLIVQLFWSSIWMRALTDESETIKPFTPAMISHIEEFRKQVLSEQPSKTVTNIQSQK